MSDHHQPHRTSLIDELCGDSPGEFISLWTVGVPLALALMGGAVLAMGASAQHWLLEHHVITHRNVIVPTGNGTGLDKPRTVIAGSAVFAVVVLSAIAGHRARLTKGDH